MVSCVSSCLRGGHGQHVVKRTGQGHGVDTVPQSLQRPSWSNAPATHALVRLVFFVDRDGHDDCEHQRHSTAKSCGVMD